MANITYFLSDKFNYRLMICNDAGPNYASSYGWRTEMLSSILTSNSDIYVIDDRIDSSEFSHVIEALKKRDSIYLLKVVDTYIQSSKLDYIQFLLSLKSQSNLFFLSPYQPEEIGQELVVKHGLDHFIQIPYAYDKNREINFNLQQRKKRIVVSGNLAPVGYPFRSKFHKQTYHKFWSLFKTAYLPHPGYPDIGQKLNHGYFGDKYINLLSQHYFMLLCPGRLKFEFLKYSECAYAGCVALGKKPISLSDLPDELFFNIDENDIQGSVKKLFQISLQELEQMASGYRQWMRINRNPEYLNRLLLKQLEGAFDG
jgi:hypothetical protein